MSIKLFGSQTEGVDELAKAIPAAIQGFYDAEDRNMKKKELAAKLLAEQSKTQRQKAKDILDLEKQGYEVPAGAEDPLGLLQQGMLTKSKGFLDKQKTDEALKKSQIAYYSGRPYQQQLETKIKEEQLAQMTDPSRKFTDQQQVAAGFTKRLEQSESEIENVLKTYDVSGKTGFVDRSLPDQAIFNYLKSSEGKQLDQAARNFITAVLRKESGAAIGKEEYETEFKKYIPLPGDDEKTIAQKALARKQAIENLKASSGGAYSYFKSAEKPQTQDQTDSDAAPWEDF